MSGCLFREKKIVSESTIQDTSACPLWVKSRHMQCNTACPLYPHSDIDCVLRAYPLCAKSGNGDLRTTVRCAEDDDNFGSLDDRAGLEPAITLSRKDWLSRAN